MIRSALIMAMSVIVFTQGRGHSKFIMEEYKFIDYNVHSYDSIVNEDIW
jgi:hypothetical protein